MAEYIEREALLSQIKTYEAFDFTITEAVLAVERTPAADVVEVVHGEWRTAYTDKENKTTGVECSECGAFYNLPLFDFGLMYNYCPNCGARMDGE